jgi:hypothetical protein
MGLIGVLGALKDLVRNRQYLHHYRWVQKKREGSVAGTLPGISVRSDFIAKTYEYCLSYREMRVTFVKT